jgi:D-alanine transaminase
VFARAGGRVNECAHSNVHIIKDGELYTAPPDELILPGIARAHLLNMCRKLGVPVHETPFDYSELMEADEVLVTSSSNLCRFADEIDGRPVGGRAPGLLELLRSSLMAEFEAATSVSRK